MNLDAETQRRLIRQTAPNQPYLFFGPEPAIRQVLDMLEGYQAAVGKLADAIYERLPVEVDGLRYDEVIDRAIDMIRNTHDDPKTLVNVLKEDQDA